MKETEYIRINEASRIPKYKQVMDSIKLGIQNEVLVMGDKILSINALSEKFNLSRDTVEKAYSLLKAQKIIVSVKGKGYYIDKIDLSNTVNVLFLINKLSSYKMRIYNAFIEALGRNAKVDLDIYHCEPENFKKILRKKNNQYDYFVIMPHFRNDAFHHMGCTNDILEIIQSLPKEKLIILDRNLDSLTVGVGKVYQNFNEDIFTALDGRSNQLKKYKKIILVYPSKAVYPYPQDIVLGFKRFCAKNEMDYEILDEIYDSMELQLKDLYITIQESDLVNLVKQVRDRHYKIGEDIGIISYNDTPLKELLGITVISTDFQKMGSTAAKIILDKTPIEVKNDFNFINRNSA
ncbi:MAG: DNA-binding transcriptional regulator YhcF (GntR family) [Saprospiraceae bacterium]|jgi:DNA-binding transcriptional regulator YhcF (GntR family)